METDQQRPTMLSSCARAATAAEARFRIPYANSKPRTTRIFALDQGAAEMMYEISEAPWNGAHFLTVTGKGRIDPDKTAADDLPLSTPGGEPALLSEELRGANAVVLISSSDTNGGAAEVIAREAYHRKIMTVGLALGAGSSDKTITSVVNAMRPFTSVLVVASDNDYVPAMLTALRA